LRERHAERAEATADAARLGALLVQADELVADLQRRRNEAEAAVQAGDQEAVDKLAAAISAGVGRDGFALLPRTDQAQGKAIELATSSARRKRHGLASWTS
jgi:hypothetical protein